MVNQYQERAVRVQEVIEMEELNMHKGAGVMLRLAQSYVPVQIYINRWDPAKGLMMGTIFPELYRPYIETAHRRGSYERRSH